MHNGNLFDILYLLLAAIAIVAVFKRLHLSPVLGYLVAGAAIGPHALNYVHATSATQHIAEFGVVFLLFMIGLELTFERLKSMRLHVFGFGTAQMILTWIAIGGIALLFGLDNKAALIIGGALALSSTAVVLQVLAERHESSTQVGRLALATLILQDLAVVPLLIMVPLLANEHANIFQVIADSTFKAVIALGVIFVIGRRLLRPLYNVIANTNSPELFIATTLLIMMGAAVLTFEAGLSLALGAFLAGLLIAETEYHHQVAKDIEPFKDLLMGLFFMSVGMSLNLQMMVDNLGIVIILTLTLISIKSLLIMILSRIFGFRQSCALQAGLLLSQGGEFAFVLFGLALHHHLFSTEMTQILLVVVTFSMALTPLLAAIGSELSHRLQPRNPLHFEEKETATETLDLAEHIIVLGFNKPGEVICSLLNQAGIPFVATDSSPKNIHRGRKEGYPVYYGKTNQIAILEAVGINRAKAVAVMLDDQDKANAAVAAIRSIHHDITIIARARDRVHAGELRELGATIALAELFESSMMLGMVLMKKAGKPPLEAARIADEFRAIHDPKSKVRYSYKQTIRPSDNTERT